MGVIARHSVRGTVWTYMGVFVGVVTTFFVLTRFLTAEEIGLARVLIDAATLFIGLAQLGTSTSIVRFFPYFNSRRSADSSSPSGVRGSADPYNGFFFWTALVPLVGFCLFALIYVVCKVPLTHYFQEKSPLFVDYYYLVLPLAFFMLYQTVFETSSTVLMRTVFPRAVVREFLVRVMLLVMYLLYAFRVVSMDGFVVGLCLVYAVAALLNICYLTLTEHVSFRPNLAFPSRELRQMYMRYTGFLVLSAAVSVFAPLLSSFMVSAKMGLDYTGIYTIAFNMAVMISIPSRSMSAVAQPQLASAIKEGDRERTSQLVRQVSTSLLLVGSLIFLAIWLNIDLIYHILPNGSTYSVARTAVLYLCISQLFITAFNITIPTISYSRYYYLTLVFSLGLTLSLVFLNNRLIPKLGIEGAALSAVIANSVYFAFLIAVMTLILRVRVLSWSHLKIALLLLAALAVNMLWQRWLTPIVGSVWVDSLLRSVVILAAVAAIAYKGRFAPDINEAIKARFAAEQGPLR